VDEVDRGVGFFMKGGDDDDFEGEGERRVDMVCVGMVSLKDDDGDHGDDAGGCVILSAEVMRDVPWLPFIMVKVMVIRVSK